jgi:hypothetical protein
MDETPNQSSRAESDPSIGLTANVEKTRIEQLCEAVRGLSPEFKSAWYDFKTEAHRPDD